MKFLSGVFVYLLVCCFSASAYAGYQAGDVVNDYTWLESDGSQPVSNSIYDVIDCGKVLIFEIGATW